MKSFKQFIKEAMTAHFPSGFPSDPDGGSPYRIPKPIKPFGKPKPPFDLPSELGLIKWTDPETGIVYWVRETDGQLFIYVNGQWIPINDPRSPVYTGPDKEPEKLPDDEDPGITPTEEPDDDDGGDPDDDSDQEVGPDEPPLNDDQVEELRGYCLDGQAWACNMLRALGIPVIEPGTIRRDKDGNILVWDGQEWVPWDGPPFPYAW